jgi:lipopolysaccharide/colanic/teichoic acid biosynthesis glycosyltransferase
MHDDRGVAQPGSAPALGAGGRRFESGRPDHAPPGPGPGPQEHHIEPIPIEPIPIEPTRRGYAIGKRALDLGAAGAGLVVTSPLLAAIAIAVKTSSPGPVLFRQERVGLGGRPFMAYKFRSMLVDADESKHREHVRELMRADGEATATDTWKPIEGDARVTRVGTVLRRAHLDELPQLFNILRGEMSLVGPRPPIPYEVEMYEPWHRRRLSVVPGLTGLWQATGWGSLSFDEGVRLDVEYIERRSLVLDLRIIGRTLVQWVRGRQF